MKRFGRRERERWMRTPPVDLSLQDLQDSSRRVTAATVRRDYAPRRGCYRVYPAYVYFEDLPAPRLVEEEGSWDDDWGGGYDWSEIARGGTYPPVKILVRGGRVEILDGNHRLTAWAESGYNAALMWVVQMVDTCVEGQGS